MREDLVTCPGCDGERSTPSGDVCGVCLGAGMVVDAPPITEECDICEGEGEVPCDCHLCRSPEGRACGVLGHVGHLCPSCGGTGEIPVACAWCGYDLSADARHTEHGPVCATCYSDAKEAA